MSNPIIAPIGAIYVHEGVTVPIVPETDIAAGEVVVLGRLVGVTKFGIAAGARGSITVQGVFHVVKDPSTNIPVGAKLYWSPVSLHVVKTESTHPLLGIAVSAAAPGTTTVQVRFHQ